MLVAVSDVPIISRRYHIELLNSKTEITDYSSNREYYWIVCSEFKMSEKGLKRCGRAYKILVPIEERIPVAGETDINPNLNKLKRMVQSLAT